MCIGGGPGVMNVGGFISKTPGNFLGAGKSFPAIRVPRPPPKNGGGVMN